ncbi:TOX high mobility group box family member 2-like isoform X1 [Lates japonicus]|uniref:TOX high mobility group box family member 2-like isoform X1 n=1 Tax=Lates japonicus TaxID=270547 RepID=A0AAD3RN75_LATJO|nr:TOX high mobility group box family member 2-like isoform X1 [Lates japonicus]
MESSRYAAADRGVRLYSSLPMRPNPDGKRLPSTGKQLMDAITSIWTLPLSSFIPTCHRPPPPPPPPPPLLTPRTLPTLTPIDLLSPHPQTIIGHRRAPSTAPI